MRHLAPSALLCTAFSLLLVSCEEPVPDTAAGRQKDPPSSGFQLVPVDGLGTVELIGLLANPNELTRFRAHQELQRHLILETGHPDYPDRLTRFHKYAPHACKAGHEAQTVHILGLFAEQEDISSILIKQCLRSPHAQVRATALEIAHFSDNPPDEAILAFDPDPATLASLKIALQRLGTPQAAARLEELTEGG